MAKNLFPDQDPVGQEIQIRNVPFKIIGVLAEKGQTAGGSDQDDVMIAPYTTVQTRLAGRQFIPQILASTAYPADIPAAMQEIKVIMREPHRLATWEDDDFTVRNQTDLAEAAESTTEVMTMLLAAIASHLAARRRHRHHEHHAGVGHRAHARDRHPPGDRRARLRRHDAVPGREHGHEPARRRHRHPRPDSPARSVLGHFTGWSTVVSPPTVLLALAVLGRVGIFFGFYPARKAAGLNPIDALRYE